MHPIRILGLALLVPCIGCDGASTHDEAPPVAPAADQAMLASGRIVLAASHQEGLLTHGQHASSSRRYHIEGRLVQAQTPEAGR